MKKLAFLTATAIAISISAAPARAAETVAVVVSGKALDPAPSYKAGGEQYLDAKRVGEIYGGQVYWYPVSGRVQLSLRGRSLQFVVDSAKASAGEETLALTAPVIVRAGQAFIPVSLLRSDAFARWSGFDARWDAATRTLQVERRTTAGPVHAFSYKGRTRIVLELGPGVAHEVSARGVGSLDIVVPFGVVEGDDRVDVDDGVVASYAVKQEPRAARVTVRFAESGQRWTATELADPRRLVVDVFAPGVVPPPPPRRPPPPSRGPRRRAGAAPRRPPSVAASTAPAPAPPPRRRSPRPRRRPSRAAGSSSSTRATAARILAPRERAARGRRTSRSPRRWSSPACCASAATSTWC